MFLERNMQILEGHPRLERLPCAKITDLDNPMNDGLEIRVPARAGATAEVRA